MRKLVFIVSFCLTSLLLSAQDVHWSQWTNNPLFLNPALSAYFDGQLRISTQQRGQWANVSEPFSTTALGLDGKFSFGNIGAQLILDEAGSSQLQNTHFNLSYALPLKEWRLGGQLGFAQRNIDYSGLQFGEDESFPSVSRSYIDLGIGLTRKQELSYGQSLLLGASCFHLNSPNQSLIEQEDRLPLRWQSFVQYERLLNESWMLTPSLMYQRQGIQQSLMLGSQLKYDLGDAYDKAIQLQAAVYHRWKDAFVLSIGMGLEATQVAFSYDWNVSNLVPASQGLGAWEISFIHILQQKIPKHPGYKVCPVYL